ncbi:GNAT superfamily N-acetyltransferase [Nakamurella sp. UYEF19]|uniref:GNAT family N-acetyltransferase n=1 Tax=Nakamurella sp. UYEF19 TaxID=1756392 RepID=UPI0033937B5D
MTPVIRTAVADDAAEVAEVYLASVKAALPYLARPHTDDEVRTWVAQTLVPSGGVIVAVAPQGVPGRSILGFAAVAGDSLDHLYVRPDLLRSGVGSALLAEAVVRCPSGITLFVFQRNAAARAFYRSRGFRVASFTDGSANEEREPDLVMVRPPEPADQPGP